MACMHDAEVQLQEIHRQVARASEFRGFRPGYLMVIGVAAVVVGAIHVLTGREVAGGVAGGLLQWMLLGVVTAIAVLIEVLVPELRAPERYRRTLAVQVIRQFSPALVLATAVGLIALTQRPFDGGLVPYLPSLFAGAFGLSIVAIAPFVPTRAGLASWWYLAAAVLLVPYAPEDPASVGIVMGVTFGGGHLLTALLLRDL